MISWRSSKLPAAVLRAAAAWEVLLQLGGSADRGWVAGGCEMTQNPPRQQVESPRCPLLCSLRLSLRGFFLKVDKVVPGCTWNILEWPWNGWKNTSTNHHQWVDLVEVSHLMGRLLQTPKTLRGCHCLCPATTGETMRQRNLVAPGGAA